MSLLPEQFLERQRKSFSPEEFDAFAASLDASPPVSVRLNPMKRIALPGERVPWCDDGRYLPERPVFTGDPLFHGGAYYVQEASSMFAGWLAGKALGENAGPRILDLCAAPGGKTTLLAAVAGRSGTVVANEAIRSRAGILAENVKKWGSGNVAVTSNDPAAFAALDGFFDLVIVDAPCSGEGMFRKDPSSRGEWSPGNVTLCAARQRRIAADAWPALREGGVMIYSTCTFNRQENEDNALWIAGRLGGEIFLPGDVPEGVEVSDAGYRFYPHKVRGEGFFAAAIHKSGNSERREPGRKKQTGKTAPVTDAESKELNGWVGEPLTYIAGGDTVYGLTGPMSDTVGALRGNFNLLYGGVAMGNMIRGELKPSHPLALYHDLDRERVQMSKVDRETALDYLRRRDIDPAPLPEGLSLVSFEGVGIGWIKRMGRRCNNHYPVGWRIVNY